MDNRKLVALAKALRHKTPQEVDEQLRRQRLDLVDRVAVKHLLASSGRRAVHAGGELATDPPSPAVERTLRRLGLTTDEPISIAELDARMTALGLSVEARIGTKILLEAHGLLAAAPVPSEAARRLETLNIQGVITLAQLEERLDNAGIGSVALRTAIRVECQRRGLLTLRARSLQASADKRTGLTLRSRP